MKPQDVHDVAGLVEFMRRLKEQSGLTYRQLEERAADRGEVLARSTLADALRGDGLPRAGLLAAFLRACGEERHVEAWLEARDRIAAGALPGGGGASEAACTPEPAPTGGGGTGQLNAPQFTRPPRTHPWWRTRLRKPAVIVGAVVILAVAGLASLAYLPGRASRANEPVDGLTPPSRGVSVSPAANCRNGACRGEDARVHRCVDDAKMAAGVKTQYGLIALWYSALCQALWADVSPHQNKEIVSVHVKSGQKDAVSHRAGSLTKGADGSMRTPMMPSEIMPAHGEVCVFYRDIEACANSDGFSRVKPYPSPRRASSP
ncbi:DUF2690 domain-containing protein [Streptomyces roseifaciens]